MKFILFFLVFATTFNLQAKQIELNITNKWKNQTSNKQVSTTVKAVLGQSWKIPLESTPDMFLRMTVSQYSSLPEFQDDPQEILLKAELLKVIDGKESIVSRPEVITVLGKEASITSTYEKNEVIELTIMPTRIADKI